MSQAIAKTNGDAFKQGFARIAGQIKAVLPPHVPFEKFERTVMMAVQKEPKLLQCDQRSLFLECQKAASDGLLPDGREGVIVYRWNSKLGKNVAVWQPMVAGLMKLARNSGEIASLTSQVVYEGEALRIVLGDEEKIEHERRLDLPENPKIVGAYAIARLKGEPEPIREFMSWAQIEKVRNVNKDWQKGPWAAWPDEMARKSVMRRLSKKLPLSTDRPEDDRLQRAIERDAVIDGVAEEVLHEEPEATSDALASKLDALEGLIEGEVVETESKQETKPAKPANGSTQARAFADAAITKLHGLILPDELDELLGDQDFAKGVDRLKPYPDEAKRVQETLDATRARLAEERR